VLYLMDNGELEAHVQALMEGLGLDMTQASLKETPKRVVRMLREFTQGGVLGEDLLTTFEAPTDHETFPLVVQDRIPFRGLCEHHLLPFFGEAAVGYIPQGRVVGLSKITRLVQMAGVRRPSIQERITGELADEIFERLHPLGVIVVIRAEHTCMAVRGINAPGVRTMTSALRGVFDEDAAARAEFFSIVGWGR